MTGRVADPSQAPQQPPPPPGTRTSAPAPSSAPSSAPPPPPPAGQGGGLVRSFEGARGLAALLVALFHFGLAEPPIVRIRAGYLFVDLFFVLSGFLICAAYAGKLDRPAAVPNFLVRRIGRLLPLMLVATLAYLLLANAAVLAHRRFDGAAGAAWFYVRPPLAEWLATLTMTHSLGLFDHAIMNYATWSISTEFHAYIAFAALCLLLRGCARVAGFAVMAALAYGVSVWASVHVRGCLTWGGCMDLTFDYGYWRCLAGFFLGALLSHVRIRAPARAQSRGLAPGLGQAASLAALLAMFLLIPRMPAAALAAPLLFGFLLLSIRADAGPLARLFGAAPLQLLGRYSYSIYLMHPVILLGWNAGRGYAAGNLGRVAFVAGYVALVLTVARWTFRWVEDPMRRRFNRFAARRFGARAAAEPSAAGAQ
jgi:peptidoglycan/LPS O-acetylase OafA/YrhL